jgi:hypothetical protein
MMNCNDAYALIHDYVDGVLGAEDSLRLESHADGCARCAAEVREYHHMESMLSNMELEPVPHGFADHIVRQLRASGRIAESKAAGLFSWVPAPLRIPLAGAVLLLVAVALFPATVGVLEGMVGKGTVLVADTYFDIQERATDVGWLTTLIVNLQKSLHMLKAVVMAGVTLIASIGGAFMIPALATLLVLMSGIGLFFRAVHRKAARHAMFSI